MKRRHFLFLALAFAGKSFAATVWAIKGKLGYTDIAPAKEQKFKKSCATCKHLFRDATIKGAALCQQPGIKAAAKAEEVHVKLTGWCQMWQKDS